MMAKRGTGTIPRTVGNNLSSIISTSLATDRYTAVLELVLNGYDEDANTVRVDYDLEGSLVVDDDGAGMDAQGMQNFFRSAGSKKRDNPVSPGGRKVIGKRGLAKTLLEYLGESYTLETWQGGHKITVSENFDEVRQGVKPRGVETEDTSRVSGTRITVSGLKFKPSDLEIPTLSHTLEWQAPSVADFDIYLNGLLVPKRSMITWSSEYILDELVPGVGRVHGSFYYANSSKPPDTSGIFIYVNRRSVGDAQKSYGNFGFDSSRLLGQINADGLEKHITADRSQFHHADDLNKVEAVISAALNLIDTDPNLNKSRATAITKKNQLQTDIQSALERAEEFLNESLGQEFGGPYRLTYALEDKPWISRVAGQTIEINGINPQLSYSEPASSLRNQLTPILIMLSLSAIADAKQGGDSTELDQEIYDSGNTIFRANTPIQSTLRLNHTNAISGYPLEKMSICPSRLYPITQLSEFSGWDENTIKLLYISGSLKKYEDGTERTGDLFKGSDALDVFRTIDGYVPAGRIISPKSYSRSIKTGTVKGRARNNIHIAQQDLPYELPPYALTMGDEGSEFIFIPVEKIGKFIASVGGIVNG